MRTRLGELARPLLVLAFAVAVGVGGYYALKGPLGAAVREVTLPLRHEDIIRQQAEQKDLDPALIAAVIYEESRFRAQTSPAGAEGLMQILPSTAKLIAERSGGTQFELHDLGNPQVNISYGSYYLRYLISRYSGDQMLAVAAYNAGETVVDKWVADAGGADSFDPKSDIHYPETREYVSNVADSRRAYRRHYADELGIK